MSLVENDFLNISHFRIYRVGNGSERFKQCTLQEIVTVSETGSFDQRGTISKSCQQVLQYTV